MQKEAIFALLEQLYLDQEKYNKFREYVSDFISRPRCKKGCMDFLEEVFNLPQIEGKEELAMKLLTSKTSNNSCMLSEFIYRHPITIGYSEALKNARYLILVKLAEYIIELSSRIADSQLSDKIERQVYLRRAVARLRTVFSYPIQSAIDTDQWPNVDPVDWIDYLTTDLKELTNTISNKRTVIEWSDVYGDCYQLDNTMVIRSVISYINYLDSFLEF